MFIDKAKIIVKSGRGGNGHVSFRREKYVPNGGPDGGDGGKGGNVVFAVDEGRSTLADFRHVKTYAAENGEDGGKKNRSGKNGADLVIKVPPGTVIKEAKSEKVIIDMSGDMRRFVLLTGGRGGKGNQHFATAAVQAPKYAKPGGEARELELALELKIIADVGLVGFPNVGKSTLLSRISNARPKIANYHFTTLTPHLGVVDLADTNGFVVADLPGLIEGAASGAGLGHEFLRHIERTKVLIHVVDIAGTEGRDPLSDIEKINAELSAYSPQLAKRPQVIAANKIDALGATDGKNPVDTLRETMEPQGTKVFPISAVSGTGLMELLFHVRHMLDEIKEEPTVFASELFPEDMFIGIDEPMTVEYDETNDEYVVEGPRIEKMLGLTNLESERGFVFFQRFLKDAGILEELEKLDIKEGATVRMYGLRFEYYR